MSPEREAELVTLQASCGEPLRARAEIAVGEAGARRWNVAKTGQRDGEVVLFLRRCDGTLLLHTKDFYPPGAMRVPSGGIKPGEPVLAAVRREVAEETGLTVAIDCLLALVEFTIRIGEVSIEYPSYSFLLREVGGELKTADADEHIAGFAQVALEDLGRVAGALEGLTGEWCEWGGFRALPHRLAAQALGLTSR